MTFPHPESGERQDWNGNKPDHRCVIRQLFKGAVNITDDRNAEHNVDPAKNRTFGGIIHNQFALTAPCCSLTGYNIIAGSRATSGAEGQDSTSTGHRSSFKAIIWIMTGRGSLAPECFRNPPRQPATPGYPK